MQWVVDSNFLQDPLLRGFLAKSKRNVAVLTDYAMMEAYKGETLQSIFKSMAILAEFPDQVIALKGTKEICGIRGRKAGLTRRLICQESTQEFREFANHVNEVLAGNAAPGSALVEHGRAASEHMEAILADAERMVVNFTAVAEIYTPEEIRTFRIREKPTSEMVRKTLAILHDLTLLFFKAHPHGIRRPREGEMVNTFLFRYALCCLMLVINWVRTGSQKDIKPEKLRNDFVDANFAALATYFDGLLTKDKKADALYNEAWVMLNLMGAAVK